MLHEEPESQALGHWLSLHLGTPIISSELAEVEVIRACRRINPEALPAARALLAPVDLIALTGSVIDEAAVEGGVRVRGLDAIHLASALSVAAELSAFVAYDERLVHAAAAVGLGPLLPGR